MKEETIYQYNDRTVIKKIQRPEETGVGVDSTELWREKSRCAINLQHSIRSKWGACLTLQVSEPKLEVVIKSVSRKVLCYAALYPGYLSFSDLPF